MYARGPGLQKNVWNQRVDDCGCLHTPPSEHVLYLHLSIRNLLAVFQETEAWFGFGFKSADGSMFQQLFELPETGTFSVNPSISVTFSYSLDCIRTNGSGGGGSRSRCVCARRIYAFALASLMFKLDPTSLLPRRHPFSHSWISEYQQPRTNGWLVRRSESGLRNKRLHQRG